jgi:hypothetical protein
MCMYVYIYTYIYIYAHLYIYIHIYTYAHKYMHICLFQLIYMSIYVCMYMQLSQIPTQTHANMQPLKVERGASSSSWTPFAGKCPNLPPLAPLTPRHSRPWVHATYVHRHMHSYKQKAFMTQWFVFYMLCSSINAYIAPLGACIHTYIHTCMQLVVIVLHKNLNISPSFCKLRLRIQKETYINTYIHTYIRTYIHKYSWS